MVVGVGLPSALDPSVFRGKGWVGDAGLPVVAENISVRLREGPVFPFGKFPVDKVAACATSFLQEGMYGQESIRCESGVARAIETVWLLR